jgi:hypothetical protein
MRANHTRWRTWVAIALVAALGGCYVRTKTTTVDPTGTAVDRDGVGSGSPTGAGAGQPVVCGGEEELTLTNVVIETAGPAVAAYDACQVTIVNARLISHGAIAVEAHDNAAVALVNVEARGKLGAILVDGDATVTAKDVDAVGAIQRRGNGRFVVDGAPPGEPPGEPIRAEPPEPPGDPSTPSVPTE